MEKLQNNNSSTQENTKFLKQIFKKYKLSTEEKKKVFSILEQSNLPKSDNRYKKQQLSPILKSCITDILNFVGLDPITRAQRLKELVFSDNEIISLKALDQSWKLDGSYAPEKHISTTLSLQDYQQLLLEKQKIEEELANLNSSLNS